MSTKGKAWKKPRAAPMPYRRSRTAIANAFRDLSTVDIPPSFNGEMPRDGRRQCYRKRPYPEAQAHRVAVSAKEEGLSLTVYPCPHCGQWHVGEPLPG